LRALAVGSTIRISRGKKGSGMPDQDKLYRSLDAHEIEALGPMPADDAESPTTDRDGRTPGLTAEVHSPGVVEQSADVADDDPFPPPRSLTAED
jgi:hypothetical protein